MSNIIEECLPELLIALTSRWRTSDGTLAIGVPKKKLLQISDITEAALEQILQQLRQKIADLGLELVDYNYHAENWYAIRSKYVCPSELQQEEESVLAYIISQIEGTKNQQVSLENILKKLTTGKYFGQYQLERIIKNLEVLGYISRRNKNIHYSCRTLLEFSPEARNHIAEETKKHIV